MKKYTKNETDKIRKELAKFIRMKRNIDKICRWSGISWMPDRISFDRERPTLFPSTEMTIMIPFKNKNEDYKK